jgi:hypothetical protein
VILKTTKEKQTMIVNRQTLAAKRGGDEAGPSHTNLLSLLKEFMESFSSPHMKAWRLYSWPVGQPMNLLVLEMEYESFEAYEKSMAEMLSHPKTPEFQRKLRELTERPVTQEIWNLED